MPYKFDATNVEPAKDFEPLPVGKYNVIIENTDMKHTRAGDGQYLNICFQVLDGDHEKRLVWHNLNLINPNDTAVEIAERDLSAICHAVGKLTFDDPAELVDCKLQVTLKIEKRKDTGEAANRITRFAPLNGTPNSVDTGSVPSGDEIPF